VCRAEFVCQHLLRFEQSVERSAALQVRRRRQPKLGCAERLQLARGFNPRRWPTRAGRDPPNELKTSGISASFAQIPL
jgi:hypothetical protein